MQVICRRWLGLLAGMYFDDMTVQDLASARGYGQRSVRELFALTRRSSDPRKANDMALQQDFCGLEHDLSETFTTGCVRLLTKMLSAKHW